MRQRDFNLNPPAELDYDDQRRPPRRSFVSGLIRWHLKEWLILIGVGAVIGMVLVNQLFLQSGPHPAPIFANRQPVMAPPTVLPRPRPVGYRADAPAAPPPAAPYAAPVKASAKSTTNDPIGELLLPSQRIVALQRALSDYGFGQIRPTGTYDPQTRSAIEAFERYRKLPVTGQISERMTRELAAMTRRTLE